MQSVDPKINNGFVMYMNKKVTIILKIKEGSRHKGQINVRT